MSDFYNGYEEARTGGSSLSKGIYEFVVLENLGAPDWFDAENGTQMSECSTEVVGGENGGDFGPRLRLQLGGYTWTKEDKQTGVKTEMPVSGEDVQTRLQGLIRSIHGSNLPPLTDPDNPTVKELADALVGDHFIAKIILKKNKEGDEFANFGKVFPMNEPPKGFVGAAQAADFTT